MTRRHSLRLASIFSQCIHNAPLLFHSHITSVWEEEDHEAAPFLAAARRMMTVRFPWSMKMVVGEAS
jgi:hypothetical protein